MKALAGRLGSYVQAYTLYSSVRPFGVTAIVGGWDAEEGNGVDAQVGSGPTTGKRGKLENIKHGGPALYMIEPSGLYWVSFLLAFLIVMWSLIQFDRATTAPPLGTRTR